MTAEAAATAAINPTRGQPAPSGALGELSPRVTASTTAEVPARAAAAILTNLTSLGWSGAPISIMCGGVLRAANTTLVQPNSNSEAARNNNGGKLLSVSKLATPWPASNGAAAGHPFSLICFWQ